MKKFSFLLFLLVTFSFLTAQTYELDKSFGENGVIKLPINDAGFCVGYKIELLDDGSFLIYSTKEQEEEIDGSFDIWKFNSNGKLDTDFADGGVFSINASYFDSPVYFCLLPENKLAVPDLENLDTLKIQILNKNGIIDRTISFNQFPNSIKVPIKILYKEGFLYIGGIQYEQNKLFVLKTDLNGKLDSTYAENGVFTLPQSIFSEEFIDMEFQNNDIVLYSSFYEYIEDSFFNQIFRINQKGKFDVDFGNQGYFSSEEVVGFGGLSIDNKNRIVINAFADDAIYRLNENGLPDPSFGNKGKVSLVGLSLLGNYFFHNIMNNNDILLFGSLSSSEYEAFGIPVILKLKENGIIDNSFGSSGLLVNNINSLALNLDGEIDKNNNLMTVGSYQISPNDDFFGVFLTRLKPKTSSDNNIPAGQELTIYPNPVYSDKITIQFPENIEAPMSIKVLDLLGNYVFRAYIPDLGNNIPELSFNIPDNLKNGQYLVVINIGKEVYSNKIIIQR